MKTLMKLAVTIVIFLIWVTFGESGSVLARSMPPPSCAARVDAGGQPDDGADAAEAEEEPQAKQEKEEVEQQNEEAARDKREARDQRQAELYQEAYEALDGSEWEKAIASFTRVANMAGSRADGALYWKAYALAKLRRSMDALGSLEELRKLYTSSRWLNDAKALEVEIHQRSGKDVTSDAGDDEELKLIALNGLAERAPERAIPMLEGILQGSSSPKMKEQALFVLTQTGEPKARDLVAKVARGQGVNPDLQRKALEYLGMFESPETSKILKEIYASSVDTAIKRSILQAFMTSDDTASLLAAARTEKDPGLRREAIQALGSQGAKDALQQLYKSETSFELREAILQGLGMCEDGMDALADAARGESDARLRRTAIQSLGMVDSDRSGPLLLSLYESEKDLENRSTVLEALMMQENVRALITIARKETNLQLKKKAVEMLSQIDSKEATDYLMELLSK